MAKKSIPFAKINWKTCERELDGGKVCELKGGGAVELGPPRAKLERRAAMNPRGPKRTALIKLLAKKRAAAAKLSCTRTRTGKFKSCSKKRSK